MSFRHFLFAFSFCLTSLFPAFTADAAVSKQAPPKDTPMPYRSTVLPSGISLTYLPNGLAVAVKKDTRFPLASLRLYVHAGSAFETPDIAGISHQLEHMVFKGTESRPKGAIATDIEKAGGYLNAATSFDYTVYLTDMPSEHWKLGMDVLKDMAFHPSLEPEELESEKEVVLAELQRGEDSPSNRLFKRVQASVLKGTPYERPIIGYPETIRAYTVEKMRAYIKNLYQPQSMMLLVVGDVDPAAVLEEATKTFGDLANTAPVVPPKTMLPEEFPAGGPQVEIETTPWNKAHISVSFPGVAQMDARAPALDVFSQLLAGDTSAYLYKTYKYDKRLVDTISVSSYTFERTGLFTISATLDPDKLGVFWESLVKDLAALAHKKFPKQELDRAKLAVTDGLYRQKETVAGTASALGYFLFFGGGEDAEQTYLQQIDLADEAAIAKAASSVLRPERLSLSVLAPKMPPQDAARKKAPPREPDTAWYTKTLLAAWPMSKDGQSAAAKADTGPEREVIELGKGRTLILQPDASMPYAAVDLVLAGGDSLLQPDQQGLAALAAAVLTRGTKTMDAVALEAFKNDRAASLSAGSGRETFRISMDYPVRFAPDMWNLLHETLTSATLPEKEVERSKENQIAAVVSREDQPLGLAFRRIFPFLFGPHLYGYQSQGDTKTVAAFKRSDVAAFWKRQARAPWVLSVCGTFDRDAVIAAAKKLPAPAGEAPAIAPPAWSADKDLTITLPERNQAHLFLVFPAAPVGSADEPGMDLLQNILAGQSGLLFRDLRDKQGLGYTVTAFQWQAPLAATLMFYIGTEPDKVAVAKEGFAKVIAELHANALPEEELTRGKNQMQGDYVRARQRMSARSAEAANLAILGRPLDAEKAVIDAAMRLTPEELQTLARKYLIMAKAYVVTVVPR
ncbi:Peptidase, M16 family [uncultured delta proteobacterium]|uniref:Peptidase, M16 family n=1 Tax=uncultured delta proteobacterium TaxID=34034 RepID=A0A212IT94_9DELT|nr:Peptidase, M16 family [uncultured delta proteobacterium]